MKIGYAPNSLDAGHPADRRRLMYWAKSRGHEVILDLSQKCNVIVLSGRADFTRWSEMEKRPPLILDLVDGYLGNEYLWRDWLRGIGKVVAGDITGAPRPYRTIIRDACRLAQAVVCETIEQKETIHPYCANTHTILDFHEEFPMIPFNQELQTRNFPALMWEGLPFTARGLLLLKDTFSEMSKANRISLEVVTDMKYPLLLGKYFYHNSERILRDIPEKLGENFRLTEWSISAVVDAAKRSHIAVLPLDPHGSLNPLKAENRLLIMWRMGLPTLTSPSLAYARVMKDAQINGICHEEGEWQIKITELMNSVEMRRDWVEKGQQYIRDTHSENKVLEAWDRLFESVL